jgi:hypothetical protein
MGLLVYGVTHAAVSFDFEFVQIYATDSTNNVTAPVPGANSVLSTPVSSRTSAPSAGIVMTLLGPLYVQI